jgi:hypothetical protein
VGGTGKTPLVLWLANSLRARGWQPGIVSRGYAGEGMSTPMRVLPQSDLTWWATKHCSRSAAVRSRSEATVRPPRDCSSGPASTW